METKLDITSAAKTIRDGGLVAFPTETVYGLGANALDAVAVASIFELKGRPRFDPLIAHIADASQLADLVRSVPALAAKLIERFWPGPLSIVLEKQPSVPDIVTAGLPSIAIRCPDHDVARALIRIAGVPVAAPSANRFGMVSPTKAAHVREQFGTRSPIVLDDGPCRIGVESTVVSFVENEAGLPTLLRPGGVTLEEIEEVAGPIEIRKSQPAQPTSPGQLSSHYAPATPLVLSAEPIAADGTSQVGLLTLQSPELPHDFAAMEILSEDGCLREAAAHLFAAIRRLDALGLDYIIARPVPEVGIGLAIMDRLRRAAVTRC